MTYLPVPEIHDLADRTDVHPEGYKYYGGRPSTGARSELTLTGSLLVRHTLISRPGKRLSFALRSMVTEIMSLIKMVRMGMSF